MSSELVKKLEANAKEYNDRGDSMVGFGIHLASLTVEAHEAEQMKEPFYQLGYEQEKLLEKCKKEFRRLRIIYTTDKACEDLISMYPLNLTAIYALKQWAIEQDKKEEEEAE